MSRSSQVAQSRMEIQVLYLCTRIYTRIFRQFYAQQKLETTQMSQISMISNARQLILYSNNIYNKPWMNLNNNSLCERPRVYCDSILMKFGNRSKDWLVTEIRKRLCLRDGLVGVGFPGALRLRVPL